MWQACNKNDNFRVWKYCAAILLTGIILVAAYPQVSAEEYRIQSYNQEDVHDISLQWSKSFGTQDWKTFKLWDDGISTHCYISFKFNTGAKANIPASLRIEHPTSTMPGQQFNIKTALNFEGDRELTLTSEFFIKIDLDLPGITTYIPELGWVDDIENVYGGAWEYTFNLNSQSVNSLMNKVFLGDGTTLQSFSKQLGINDIITVENLNINSQTLGNIASGQIRIDILRAILTAAKQMSNLAPPLPFAVNALDWLLTNVIKTSAGIILTPTVSAQLVSNVYSSEISLGTSQLVFNEDISAKQMVSSVSNLAKETNYNELSINYSPIEYKLLFDVDWDYYLNVDVDVLNLDIYEKNWRWNLGTFPRLSDEVCAISKQVSCSLKLDEPLQATAPSDNYGEVKIELSDSSGLSNVKLFYSEDKTTWQNSDMVMQESSYAAKPIASVSKDTTIYYYIEAFDGDNDLYRIDNQGAYYTYSLRPEPTFNSENGITQTNLFADIMKGDFSSPSIAIIVIPAVVVIILLACVAFIMIRKKRQKVQVKR